MVDFAFGQLDLRRLRSGHAADNLASGNVLRKLGFEKLDETEVWSKPRRARIRQVRYALGRRAAP